MSRLGKRVSAVAVTRRRGRFGGVPRGSRRPRNRNQGVSGRPSLTIGSPSRNPFREARREARARPAAISSAAPPRRPARPGLWRGASLASPSRVEAMRFFEAVDCRGRPVRRRSSRRRLRGGVGDPDAGDEPGALPVAEGFGVEGVGFFLTAGDGRPIAAGHRGWR